MSVETETSLEQMTELVEFIDRPRICEPVGLHCGALADWWLILSCGHVWAACKRHRISQERVLPVGAQIECTTDLQIVSWRWEPIQ